MKESEIIASTLWYMLKDGDSLHVAKGAFPLWVTEVILRIAKDNLFLSVQSQVLLMGYARGDVKPLPKNKLDYDVCDLVKREAKNGGYIQSV